VCDLGSLGVCCRCRQADGPQEEQEKATHGEPTPYLKQKIPKPER